MINRRFTNSADDMKKRYLWKGESNRGFGTYRPCRCGCDYRDGVLGVGYLSASDDDGNGFTIWIEDERIYARVKRALRSTSCARSTTICTNCNEGLQNAALPKPDQVWLLSQVRRATINDQRAVLAWLTGKFKLPAPPKS